MRWRRHVLIAIVAFLTTIDNTIVNVALPSIQRDLSMSLPALEWVVTGYIVTFAGLMLAGGRLADRYGQRRILLCGLAVFTAASLLAGTAADAGMLLAARAIQGSGAALALPAAQAVAAGGSSREERDRGAAVWMAALAVALAAGPIAGGWLSQHLGWRWVFLVNLPPGLAGMLLCRAMTGQAPPGAGSSAGLLTLVRERAVSGGVVASALWGSGVNGVFFFTSLFLQRAAGFSATRTGLVFVPLAVFVVLAAPAAPALAGRLGTARTVASGLVLVSAGLALVALTRDHVTVLRLLPGLAMIGAGSALTAPLTSSVIAAVPPASAGAASGMLSVAREGSGLAGIFFLGLIVAGGRALPARGAVPVAFVHGYGTGLLIAAGLALAGAVVAARTLPG